MRPALDPSEEQAALADAFAAFFAKEAPPERVRSAEPLGFDGRLWTQARALGLPEMALAGGAALADLAVVAEQAGRSLAPIPVVEALVAARLLERLDACPDDVASGDAIATLAVHPVIDGVARLVSSGAVADVVVARDGDAVVAVRGSAPMQGPPNLGALPIADRDIVDGRFVEATGDAAIAAWAETLAEWRVLTAAALVGVARGAMELAVDYAKVRRQFGVPIGSFQAIQHRLADLATSTDGSALLARFAAVDEDRRRALAPMASWFAARTAREVTGACLHVHGGYGFMLEQDIQLFFRRATAWGLALGDPADELARVADALDEVGWTLDDDSPAGTDEDGFRAEVREFLAEHYTPDVIDRARTSGTNHDWSLHHALADRGWVAAEWRVEDGGQGRDAWELLDLMEEMARAGAPIDGWGTSNLVAHTLVLAGTPDQRGEVVPRILRGEILCCLGYSEPDSGSDVAAAATRAVRDGDGWVINGQKMFTTLAQEAAYVFLLTRTNPDVPKHRGLTLFLVPMDADGIEITPIATLGGERTNVTFYTDVRVPDSCRVGEVDGGWDVMNIALAFERNPTMVGELDHLIRQYLAWAHDAGVLERPTIRARLAEAVTDLTVGRVLGIRMTAAVARGELPHADGSKAKLFASEALVRAAANLLDTLGAGGVLAHGAPDVAADGWVEHALRHAQVTTIQAGTSEIQRTIIAERALNLPRSPR